MATFVLIPLGVPFAVTLGLLVALLDLIPLVGATIAAVIVVAVAFLHSPVAPAAGRQPDGPLVILISVLVGAELAGVLGAYLPSLEGERRVGLGVASR